MQSTADLVNALVAPSWRLMGAEPLRAALEYAGLRLMNKSQLPRGDGHAIVVFPGLASDRRATAPLMRFCESLGYTVHDWGRGFNTGPKGDPSAWMDGLAQHVDEMTAAHAQPLTLIGSSLGGVYAREVAKRLPRRVRQVITLGTPLAGSAEHTNVGLIYRLLNGRPARFAPDLCQQLKQAPPVPTTAIYSRSDGIVSWQTCLQAGAQRHTENVEVHGSHCGLTWNPAAMAVVADRLGQPLGSWRPYAAQPRAAQREARLGAVPMNVRMP